MAYKKTIIKLRMVNTPRELEESEKESEVFFSNLYRVRHFLNQGFSKHDIACALGMTQEKVDYYLSYLDDEDEEDEECEDDEEEDEEEYEENEDDEEEIDEKEYIIMVQ